MKPLPQISNPLPHHPAIHKQIRPIWLAQGFVEGKRDRYIKPGRYVQLEGRNKETNTSAARQTSREIPRFPMRRVETGKMPAFAFTKSATLVNYTTNFVKEAIEISSRSRNEPTPTYLVYPPTFPCTFHVEKLPVFSLKPLTPRGLFEESGFEPEVSFKPILSLAMLNLVIAS